MSRLAAIPIRSSSLPTDTRRGARLESEHPLHDDGHVIGRDAVGLVLGHGPHRLGHRRPRRRSPPSGTTTWRRCSVKSVRTLPGSTRVTWMPKGATS